MICALQSANGEDELCILGGLKNVIQHPPRSLSVSPFQITSRVSDIRTQRVASDVPRRRQKQGSYPPQSDTAPLFSSQDFDFSGLSSDFGFAALANQNPAPLPTYEQIMNGVGPTQPAPYGGASSLDCPPGEPSSSGVFASSFNPYGGSDLIGGAGHEIWRSFVGGLMSGPTGPPLNASF